MKNAITHISLGLMLAACTGKDIEVTITNNNDLTDYNSVVEIQSDSVLNRLGSTFCNVTDAEGNVIPSQITYDGKLLFKATVGAKKSERYHIIPSDTLPTFNKVVSGRVYPERADDIAWENELVGFRLYGPATQAKGEKAFGYDIFFKYPTSRQIIELLYKPETDPVTWQKVDSLRAISSELAAEFINSFSYHIDHGLGMDCYAVGPTLGAGTAAIELNDSICYPWCYETAQILDNGPLRFTVRLDFAPVNIRNGQTVTEHRIVTLDSESHLNKCKVWYDGLNAGTTIVTGFPRRDDSVAVKDSDRYVLAYADPTQGADNGKALLGIVLDNPAYQMTESEGHIISRTNIAPADTFTYSWGFAWDKTDIKTLNDWEEYLLRYASMQNAPLSISIR